MSDSSSTKNDSGNQTDENLSGPSNKILRLESINLTPIKKTNYEFLVSD